MPKTHLPSRLGELGRFRFVEVQLANLLKGEQGVTGVTRGNRGNKG